MVSGLNHFGDHNGNGTIRDRFNKNVDPDGKPDFSKEGQQKLINNVRGLKGAKKSADPNHKFVEDLKLKDPAVTIDSDLTYYNPSKIPTNAHFAVIMFHEFRHSWQFYIGLYGYWGSKYTYTTANILNERDAYWLQNKIGGDSYYDGYSRYREAVEATDYINGIITPKKFSQTWYGN